MTSEWLLGRWRGEGKRHMRAACAHRKGQRGAPAPGHLPTALFHPPPCPLPCPTPARAKLGKAPSPAPRWLGNALAWVLGLLGPKGLEFAKYSIGAGGATCSKLCSLLGKAGILNCRASVVPVAMPAPLPASALPPHPSSPPADYHYLRNYIHVARHWGPQRAQRHLPDYARRIVAEVGSAVREGQGGRHRMLLHTCRAWGSSVLCLQVVESPRG